MVRKNVGILFVVALQTLFCVYANEKKSIDSTLEKKSTPTVGRMISINALFDPVKKTYSVSLEAADANPLFIFPLKSNPTDPAKQEVIESPLLDRFFNVNKKRFIFDSAAMTEDTTRRIHENTEVVERTIVPRVIETITIPSYMKTVRAMEPADAQRILKQQAFVTQTYSYVWNMVAPTDPMLKAQAIAENTLHELNRKIASILNGNDLKERSINIEDVKQLKARLLYNAIRDFGQKMGFFDMPSLEKPWYVRHKGKIILTAAALAMLAYARYNNVLGSTTKTTTTAPAAPAPATQSALMKIIAAAKTKIADAVAPVTKQIGTEMSKDTFKAIVHRVAESEGVPSVPDTSIRGQIGDIGGHALAHKIGKAYGYKLVPDSQSTVQRPPSIPAPVEATVTPLILTPEFVKSFNLWK